jgi:tight adherence protein C
MTRTVLVVALMAAWRLAAPGGLRLRLAAATAVAALFLSPLAVVAVAALAGARLLQRRRSGVGCDDLVLLADLVVLGLSAGLAFPAALEAATDEVAPRLRREVHGVLRAQRVAGSGAGPVSGEGARLYRLAARAAGTGAPLLDGVRALADELRREANTEALVAARRLPVRLLFPLTLLILPGFVVLVVGPALLGVVERLGL